MSNKDKRIAVSDGTKDTFDRFIADVMVREGLKLSQDDAVLLLIEHYYKHKNSGATA